MADLITRRELLKLSALTPFTGVAAPSRMPQNESGQNVLIILFDALSAMNVSLYGYRRETMPNLVRFVERSTVYHNHFAAGNFTSPGTASLLTGTYSLTHKAYHNFGEVEPEFLTKNIFRLFDHYYRLVYSQNRLVEVLFDQFKNDFNLYKLSHELFLGSSMITHVFPHDDDIATLSWYQWNSREQDNVTGSLLMPDFEHYLRKRLAKVYGAQFPRGLPEVHGVGYYLIEHALDWVMSQLLETPSPRLFYIHMLPPHSPYRTRVEFVDALDDGWAPPLKPKHLLSEGATPEQMKQERRYYDEYILYVDAEFGRLVDWMEANGIFEDTIVVLTSDHGEMFERNMMRHSARVFHQPLVRVPLLVSVPGQVARQDVYSPTNAVDVLPTLLHLNGLDIPDWLQGNVLPPFQPPAPDDRPFIAFDGREFSAGDRIKKGTGMVQRWPYKLMYYWGYQNIPGRGEQLEMYDLENDPEELEELSGVKPEIARDLEAEIKTEMKKSGKIAVPD
jgi:arylsulfatase A-like enzyme